MASLSHSIWRSDQSHPQKMDRPKSTISNFIIKKGTSHVPFF